MSKLDLINNVKENAEKAQLPLAGISQYNKSQLEELSSRLEEIARINSDTDSFLKNVSMETLGQWSINPDNVSGKDKINFQYYLAQKRLVRKLEEYLYENL